MVSKLIKAIVAAAIEAQAAIDQKLGSCPDIAGTAFDQAGLKDGLQIVREYVDADEAGVALDHLRYMIEETGILISAPTRAALDDVCRGLNVPRVASRSTTRNDAEEAPDDRADDERTPRPPSQRTQ